MKIAGFFRWALEGLVSKRTAVVSKRLKGYACYDDVFNALLYWNNKDDIIQDITMKDMNFSEADIKSALETYCTRKYYLYFLQAQGIDVSIVGNNSMFSIKNAGTMENFNTLMFYLRVALYWSTKKDLGPGIVQKAQNATASAAATKKQYVTKLARLKGFNERINKDSGYATIVQAVNAAQPVILTQENLDNIKTYYKQKKKETYKGAIYSQNEPPPPFHYICPQVWCIVCELPFSDTNMKECLG